MICIKMCTRFERAFLILHKYDLVAMIGVIINGLTMYINIKLFSFFHRKKSSIFDYKEASKLFSFFVCISA